MSRESRTISTIEEAGLIEDEYEVEDAQRNTDGTITLRLKRTYIETCYNGEAVPLPQGKYHATLVFRDPEGPPLVAKRIEVTNFTPKLEGAVPGPESKVFREAWACRRGQ